MGNILKSFNNLFYLIKPYWKYGRFYLFGRILLSVIIAPSLALIDVSIIQIIINAISTGATFEKMIKIIALLIGIKFGLTVLRWSFLLLYDRWKAVDMQNIINRGIYEQAVRTDFKYFDNPKFYNDFTFVTGELAAKSESALQLLTDILSVFTVIFAMTAYLSAISLWIVLISIAGQVICLFAQKIIQKLGIAKTMKSLPFERRLQYVHRIAYQKQYAADMKISNLSKKIFSMFKQNGDNKVGVFKKLAKPNMWANMIQFTAWHLCEFAQLAYIISCVFLRNFVIGTVAGMFAAAGKLNNQLNQIVGISAKMMEISLYADKIREFFNHKSIIETQNSGVEPADGAFAIELHNVSFSYPNSSFMLDRINISINPGEKIAIVGENGAGKSTLAKLLLRLYDVNEGEIIYNNIPIQDYNIHELRKKIGIAFQESQLYALTVRDNMELFNSANDTILTNVLDTIELDMDLNGEVTREFEDNGIMLSGGQAQKLGLGRILHGDFGLLLLDEPSSALDPIAEYKMAKLIFDLSKTTTIMVAHRLSTIRNADKIYLITDGNIAECGTHDELMTLGKKYAEMFSKQAENYIG